MALRYGVSGAQGLMAIDAAVGALRGRAEARRISLAVDAPSDLPLVLADLRQLPLQAASFDGLWAAASLMHLPKPVARLVLTDLYGLIRPGGVFAATVTYGVTSLPPFATIA